MKLQLLKTYNINKTNFTIHIKRIFKYTNRNFNFLFQNLYFHVHTDIILPEQKKTFFPQIKSRKFGTRKKKMSKNQQENGNLSIEKLKIFTDFRNLLIFTTLGW